MRPPRLSISVLMAVVAFLAVDIAALQAKLPAIPNPGLVVMVLVLEIGLLIAVGRTGPGRAYWIGFEVCGWAYVLAGFAFERPIWRLSKTLYETHVLRSPITDSRQTFRLILLAGALQLAAVLAVSLVGGFLGLAISTRAATGRGALSARSDISGHDPAVGGS